MEEVIARRDWTALTEVSPTTRQALERASHLVETMDRLEALPQVVHRALACMADSRSSSSQLAAILNTDQAMTARMLGMANSVFYRGARRFTTVREAVIRLGYRQVRELLLAAAYSQTFGRALPLYGVTGDEMWRHSLATAVAATLLAEGCQMATPESAYLAGLLHDAGRSVLATGLEDAVAREISDTARIEQASFQQVEWRVLGFTHAEAGATLLDQWKVGDDLVFAIAAHHYNTAEANPLAQIVHIADVLAVMAGFPSSRIGWVYNVDPIVAEGFDLQRWLGTGADGRMEATLQEIRAGVQQAYSLIGAN